MTIAAVDLAMLNMGGRMLIDRVEACNTEHADWGKAELDTCKARVSGDLRARMEQFLSNSLKDVDAEIVGIRILQREHREQLERKIPHKTLASAVHLAALVID